MSDIKLFFYVLACIIVLAFYIKHWDQQAVARSEMWTTVELSDWRTAKKYVDACDGSTTIRVTEGIYHMRCNHD